MKKLDRMVIWLCCKFTRAELETIIAGLLDVLANRNPEVKPKDDFKEKHPNYRKFSVDPNPPLTKAPEQKELTKNWRTILKEFFKKHGKQLEPIKNKNKKKKVPGHIRCLYCNAPAKFLYYNNGKRRSQISCKVCNKVSMISKRKQISKAPFFCPYCQRPLFRWKHKLSYTIFKCDNDKCPLYLKNLERLNPAEKKLRKKRSSQFKLRYQYRVYHFSDQQLSLSKPQEPTVHLARIHKHSIVVGLILSLHVSYANSARKTALIIRQMFGIPVSYQTVLNYAEAASFWCHRFNLYYKGSIDPFNAGDETYIKIMGKWAYTFLFIAVKSLKIIAYHVANDRSVLPAIVSIKEAVRTALPNRTTTAISDDNPSYGAAIHYLNSTKEGLPIEHRKVIGLQNLDEESETFRPYKQVVERLMRTYKFHIRPAHGFVTNNGAIALTTLFVTHYNFLRPHYTLKGNTPITIDELEQISTIQDKWCKIIDVAMNLSNSN